MSNRYETSYFGARGEKISEQSVRRESFYQDKRSRLAKALTLDPGSLEYAGTANGLCCCSKPWTNAGCNLHGLGTYVISKAMAARNLKKELYETRNTL